MVFMARAAEPMLPGWLVWQSTTLILLNTGMLPKILFLSNWLPKQCETWFDKLTTNGVIDGPFVLRLSKDLVKAKRHLNLVLMTIKAKIAF